MYGSPTQKVLFCPTLCAEKNSGALLVNVCRFFTPSALFNQILREELPQSETSHEIQILHLRKLLRKMSRDKLRALLSHIS